MSGDPADEADETTQAGTGGTDAAPDLVRLALDRARADTLGRGATPGTPAPARPGRGQRPARVTPVSRGPQPVAALLGAWVTDTGADVEVAVARVLACWGEVVGADIAGHSEARALAHGVLHVVAESTAWATQLRLLAPGILARVRAELASHSEGADELLREVRVTGPTGPSWKRGRLAVQGRGPRDTYG